MRVYEARPEVTVRRDHATPAAWLRGKRILVLGAGALGAPIADMCARAGAAHLTVADQALVHPGILARQPYTDADIGRLQGEASWPTVSTGSTPTPPVSKRSSATSPPGCPNSTCTPST